MRCRALAAAAVAFALSLGFPLAFTGCDRAAAPAPEAGAGPPLRAAGPAELLPLDALRDVASLDLEVGPEELRRAGPDGAARLRAFPVAFTSFTWAGETWRHEALWLLPADREPICDDCAAVTDALDLAEAAALDGVPALAVRTGFPGARHGIDDEGELMAESLGRYFREGDARWIGYGWLARVFGRAVTVAGELPGTSARRVAIAGCSKRGVATWTAAAADPRIVGGMAACWNGANTTAWLEHKQERWGDRSPDEQAGPAWQDAQRQLEMIARPHGPELLAVTDPVTFADALREKRMLIAVGTDDPLYPVTGDQVYFDLLPEGTRMALVPNVGHRMAPRHAQAWRHWLRVALSGEASPAIPATIERDGAGRLRVDVPADTAPTPPGRLAIWSAVDREGGAFRDATFAARPLELRDGIWSATLPAPEAGARLGWFVSWSVEDARAPVWRTTTFRELLPGRPVARATGQASTTRSPSRAVRSR